jgi:peptidoglycan hydrolase CwlO-like protein
MCDHLIYWECSCEKCGRKIDTHRIVDSEHKRKRQLSRRAELRSLQKQVFYWQERSMKNYRENRSSEAVISSLKNEIFYLKSEIKNLNKKK